MSQTNLKSDDFCGYNQAASPFLYIMQKPEEQGYNNTFAYGSVGVNTTSNHVRPDVINIDSFLSGRDDILSKCNPPIPALEDSNEVPLTYQNNDNTNFLQPMYTRESKSSVNLSAISHLPLSLQPHQHSNPQNVNHIIFEGAAQRGGVNTSNVMKNAWNSKNYDAFVSPQRACGQFCSEANGYMVRDPSQTEAKWGKLPEGMPSSDWFKKSNTNTVVGHSNPEYITSQMASGVGASGSGSGPQFLIHNEKLPVVGDPYDRYPVTKSPITGKNFHNSPINNLKPY
jgi:hypothetical protein